MEPSKIQQNLKQVKEKMAFAALRAGRLPDEVKLIAVTKTVGVDEIKEVIKCGVTDIGENRVQSAVEKYEILKDLPTWHMIGRLQKNKVKYIVKFCKMIHSVESIELAEVINNECRKIRKVMEVLVQVNVSGEESKQGVCPEDLISFLKEISEYDFILVRGLMTMPPICEDPEEVRGFFKKLRELRNLALKEDIPHIEMIHLSMGMTQDYEAAIEEGATMVRIGSGIFG